MTPNVHRLFLQSVRFFKPTASAQITPIFKHVEGVWIKCPEAALASFLVDSRLFYEALVQAQIMSDGVLPALLCISVVGKFIGDEFIDSAQCDPSIFFAVYC